MDNVFPNPNNGRIYFFSDIKRQEVILFSMVSKIFLMKGIYQPLTCLDLKAVCILCRSKVEAMKKNIM